MWRTDIRYQVLLIVRDLLPPSERPATSGLLANACFEEPDALIALVRICGGAPRVTGGSTRKRWRGA